MPELQIKKKQLHVQMNLLEQLAAFRRQLRIPLENVLQIDTKEVSFSSIYVAIRQLGTQIPGMIRAGAYLEGEDRIFWHVRRGQDAVDISLRDSDFDRLIIGVPDAEQTVSRLEQRIHTAPQ
jgi:hypothetical protein